MQPVIALMNDASSSGRLGGNVEHDEKDDCPRYDLLKHPITSQRALETAVRGCARRAVTGFVPSIAQGNLLTNDQPKVHHSGSAAGPGGPAPIRVRLAWPGVVQAPGGAWLRSVRMRRPGVTAVWPRSQPGITSGRSTSTARGNLTPFRPGGRAIGVTMTEVTSADFSVVVYREDEAWEAEILPAALLENLDGLIHALRQQPSIGGTIGLAAVGDDFFVALRVIGSQVSVFLSDLTASVDWPLARQVLDYLDIPVPDDDDDLDQVLPAGDLSIFADLGIDEMELGALSGDLDMFPYEVLEIIARRLGFGPALERALDGALGP